MPRSKTDICNRALGRVSGSRISDIDDKVDPNAALCRDYFPAALDYAVTRVSPQCARAVAPLARIADGADGEDNPPYRYALPKRPHCLRVLEVNGGSAKWEIIGNVLVTDSATASALYLFRPENMDDLPEHIAAVVALKLAAELSRVKQETDSTMQRLLEELEAIALPEAHLQERLQTGDNGHDSVNPKGSWYRG